MTALLHILWSIVLIPLMLVRVLMCLIAGSLMVILGLSILTVMMFDSAKEEASFHGHMLDCHSDSSFTCEH